MKQIYNFEQYNPPVLNENMLRNELEKRQVWKQTIVLAIAAIFTQILVLLFGFIVGEMYPIVAVISFVYVLISVTGSGVIAAVYVKKGGLSHEYSS